MTTSFGRNASAKGPPLPSGLINSSITRAAAPVLLIACILAACADGGSRNDTITVDTIAGLERVTTSADGIWDPDGAWGIGTAVRIGGVDGDGPAIFSQIRGIAVDADRIAVADGSNEIRVFDRAGRFQRAIGRPGEGPGEFGYLDGLAFAPDGTLLARDSRLVRITRFDTVGSVVGSIRLERRIFQLGGGDGFFVGSDGTIYDRVLIALGPSSDTLGVVRYPPDGGPPDTLTLGGSDIARLEIREGDRIGALMTVPYSPRATAAVSPSGRVASGSGADWSFVVYAPDGSPLRQVRRDVVPVPVTAEDRAGIEEQLRETAQQLIDGGTIGDFTLPTTKPTYQNLISDAEGNWWAREADGAPGAPETRTWHVFDVDGVYLGRVDLPEPVRVLQIGHDFIAGVAKDELDVEYAVVYELMKGG